MMNINNITSEFQNVFGSLSHKKTTTARRRKLEDEDTLFPEVDPYLVDAEQKIASSKAVRRMSEKTQVFTDPKNRHIRTRITHAGEVTATATHIAAILGLNVELTRAIALGHDIGHAPFGHAGEDFINAMTIPSRRFRHEIMGVVIAQHIERAGSGLNLTHEVLSGIIRDSHETVSNMSEEAKVVMWADRFAYVTGDYNDIVRVGFQLPYEIHEKIGLFGETQRERIRTLVTSLCMESKEADTVSFGHTEVGKNFLELKNMMYEIYSIMNASNVKEVLEKIYLFIKKILPHYDPLLVLALMTDTDVLYLASQPVLDYARFRETTVEEIILGIPGKPIKWWDPDLNW